MKKKYTNTEYDLVKQHFIQNKNKNITGRKIEEMFGITTAKNQSIIHDLRVNKFPIISMGKNGYKYTTVEDEIVKTYMSLCARGMSVLVAANGLKQYLDD